MDKRTLEAIITLKDLQSKTFAADQNEERCNVNARSRLKMYPRKHPAQSARCENLQLWPSLPAAVAERTRITRMHTCSLVAPARLHTRAWSSSLKSI